MRTISRSTSVILILLVSIFCTAAFFAVRVLVDRYTASHESDIAAIQPDERFAYKDMSGTPVDLGTYSDRPTIVNAWATWSPFSASELVMLASLKREYKDAFEVIAINRKESPETIAAYLAHIGDTNGITFLQDETDHFFNTVTGFAMPESVFYSRDGKIVVHVRGNMNESEMRAHIEAMLSTVSD